MKVLLAVDLSEPPATIQKALRMIAPYDAELMVLHVIPPAPAASATSLDSVTGGFTAYDIYDPALEKHIEKAEEHAFHEFLTERFDEPVRAALRHGHPAECILEDAASKDADLIILAHRPQSTLERLLLGSVASTVVRKSTLPTLLIPILEEDEPDASSET